MRQSPNYYIYLLPLLILLVSQRLHAQSAAVEQSSLTNSVIEAKLSDLISDENIAPYFAYFNKNETMRWQVTVPINHGASPVKGLLVYINPQDSGEIYEMWRPLLIEKNLIWIAAERGGNSFPAQRRVLQALLAVQLATKTYQINKQRIYLAGFSGGGRVASMMAPLYPEVFNGSIFMGGANDWGSKLPKKFSLMSKKSYVFINGDKDFNLKESKKVSEKFKQSGLGNVKFFEVSGLGHNPPGATWLGDAIDYLDSKNLTY